MSLTTVKHPALDLQHRRTNMSEQAMLDMIREAGFLTGIMDNSKMSFAVPVSSTNCLPELKNLINLAFQQGRLYERQV